MLFNIGLVIIIAALMNFSIAEYSASKNARIIGYSNAAFMFITVLVMFLFAM